MATLNYGAEWDGCHHPRKANDEIFYDIEGIGDPRCDWRYVYIFAVNSPCDPHVDEARHIRPRLRKK